MKKLYYSKNYSYLFVDGYNIINFWSGFENLSLEDQRDKLIDILTEYAHLTDEKIILVFDGYMVKGSPGSIYKENKLTVVFTKEHETADHFIEKELNKIGRVRNIRVATSDNIEQQIILSRGGSRISAREFEIEVNLMKTKLEKSVENLKIKSESIKSLDEGLLDILEKVKKDLDKNS